jgi:hypothetical protein
MVGIVDAMTNKLAVDACARRGEDQDNGNPAGGPISSERAIKSGTKYSQRAARISLNVIDDIINILGITRTELKECAEWIDGLY